MDLLIFAYIQCWSALSEIVFQIRRYSFQFDDRSGCCFIYVGDQGEAGRSN